MILFKIFYHINAYIKLLFYRVIYHGKLNVGKNSTFRRNFSLMIGNQGKVTIGKNCFFNNSCSLNALGEIFIGKGTIFGENVKIYDHNHRFNIFSKSIKEQGFSVGKVYIGNHCWIGSNVVILKDSVIEDNCVIGAGCVISGHIKKKSLVRLHNNYSLEEIKERDLN